ncbi:MAG: exoprotein, partial [Ramlibacter sp.]|uniref:two-partner secretion domain-containing protein n=1 Tax=Ramlibacter sp. TaxID=1917967 RepID=UPI0026266D5F
MPFAQRSVAATIAACFSASIAAQPAGLTVRHGSASVQQQAGRTTITTADGPGSRHSVLDWRSFQVPGGSSVFFSQPDAASTSINRVTGGNPSAILGTLGSNGRLVLVNPAGIAVASGASVDTAGFTASTLGMTAQDAIAGRLRFGDGTAAAGALQVQGRVLARGGDVVLIGAQLETGSQALLQAGDGDVVLAAGRQVEITGRGIEGIHLRVQAPQDRAVNLGTLAGDSVAMFAGQLRHSGLVQATGASVTGGRVVLQGGPSAEVGGTIRATASAGGGSVHLSASTVVLKSATAIDVRHARGGGEILVGGGWQGQDARIANARGVDVEAGAQLRADATLAGHGGTVVVWSDDTTRFRGAITARGAGAMGDGGQAEVSGRRQLVFRGQADLGAAWGATGKLLLDPETVTIRGGSGDGSDATLSTASLQDLMGLGQVGSALSGASYTIYESEIEGTNANISIQAGRKIQVSGEFGANELTIRPARDLKLEVKGAGAGGIDLRGMPVRTSGGGKVELKTETANQHVWLDRVDAGGSDIKVDAKGTVYLTAQLSAPDEKVDIKGAAAVFSGTHDFGGGRYKLAVDTITNDGTWRLGGRTLDAKDASVTNGSAGVIEGSGTVKLGKGALFNQGVLRPGGAGAIGAITIDGRMVLQSGSVLQMEVADGSVYDTLRATRTSDLGGTLEVAALGYAPRVGDNYVLVRAGKPADDADEDQDDVTESLRGGFASWNAPGFGTFAPVYFSGSTRFAQGAAPAPGEPPV